MHKHTAGSHFLTESFLLKIVYTGISFLLPIKFCHSFFTGRDLVAFASKLSEAAQEYKAIGVSSVINQEHLVMQQFNRATREPMVRKGWPILIVVILLCLLSSTRPRNWRNILKKMSLRGSSGVAKGLSCQGGITDSSVLKDEFVKIWQKQNRALSDAKLADQNFQSTLQDIKTQMQKWQLVPQVSQRPCKGTDPFQGKCFSVWGIGAF